MMLMVSLFLIAFLFDSRLECDPGHLAPDPLARVWSPVTCLIPLYPFLCCFPAAVPSPRSVSCPLGYLDLVFALLSSSLFPSFAYM